MSAAGRKRVGFAAALALALLATWASASRAGAADRVYWVETGAGGRIAYAALDGSEGGTVDTGGLPVADVRGLAFDVGAQQVYWANRATRRISFGSLLGQGAENFETGELEIGFVNGLAVDPAGERIYFANTEDVPGNPSKIVVANLDGSFARTVDNLGTATLHEPTALALDLAAGRLYWTNAADVNTVAYANLDGSGGGNLNATGAGKLGAVGLAIDRAHGRAYWANSLENSISYAKLDGTGGGNLPTGAATVNNPNGVALDLAAGRIYWGNVNGNKISYANLDGSGGGDLATPSLVPAAPRFPVVFLAPRSTSPPVVGGTPRVGSTLSCTTGGWGPDHLEAQFYEAPQSFRFQWTRDGLDVPGATGASITADVPGAYACRVSARNRSGEAVRGSATVAVRPVAFGASAAVTLRLASHRISKGRVSLQVVNANGFPVTGSLAGSAAGRKLPERKFTVKENAKSTLRLKLPAAALRGRRVKLALTATVTDLAGNLRKLKAKATARPAR